MTTLKALRKLLQNMIADPFTWEDHFGLNVTKMLGVDKVAAFAQDRAGNIAMALMADFEAPKAPEAPEVPPEVDNGLRSALAYCVYLKKHWPEVGDLPSVDNTMKDVVAALDALKKLRHPDPLSAAALGLASDIRKIREGGQS